MFGLAKSSRVDQLNWLLNDLREKHWEHRIAVRQELDELRASVFPSVARTRLAKELRYVASDMDDEEVVRLVRDQISRKRMS